MNIAELNNYNKWLPHSPLAILMEVMKAGGWKVVFPGRLPTWASKVRNYFNVLPSSLTRLPAKNARHMLDRVQVFKFQLKCHDAQSFNRNPAHGRFKVDPLPVHASCPAKASKEVRGAGTVDTIAVNNALTEAVYVDEWNRPWYQMSAGSTIYHWGRTPVYAPIDAFFTDVVRGQNGTPVFKLISPDHSGGSNEVIVWNEGVDLASFRGGSDYLAKFNETVNIRGLVVDDPAYQGSYNYSETVHVGSAAHDQRDVKPHVAGRFFYSNPNDPFSDLRYRTFPTHDIVGQVLSSQQ